MVRWFGGAALVLLASCDAIVGFGDFNRVRSDETDPETEDDGGTTTRSKDGSKDDGETGLPGCDKTKPFGSPVALPSTINSAAHEVAPSLTRDELTIVFQRVTDADGGVLMMATRASVDDAFDEARPLDELLGDGVDYTPTMTWDGFTLYFARFDETAKNMNLHVATRPSKGSRFGAPRALDDQNSTSEEVSPYVTGDGNELYFLRFVGTAPTLWRSALDRESNILGLPAELERPDGLMNRFTLTKDKLALYADVQVNEQSDLAVARRDTPTSDFGPLRAVPGKVNTMNDELNPWVSEDECRVYFVTSRDGAKQDIFVATRIE